VHPMLAQKPHLQFIIGECRELAERADKLGTPEPMTSPLATALSVRNLLLDQGAIKITQSVWHGKIQTVKSLKGNRFCEISPQLVEHLRQYVRQWRPNQLNLLFATKNGTPWDTDVVRKRKLYPLLERLGIPRCGFHAFRHGNETVMDQESVPMAVRQTRLGHSDARTTMLYSHVVSEDGRRFAARLGDLLTK
jgi:integrase